MSELINDPMESFRGMIKELLIPVLRSFNVKDDVLEKISFETPPKSMGDFAFPCFSLAPVLSKNPQDIAEQLAQELPEHTLINYEAKGPYLNFTVSSHELVRRIIPTIFELGDRFGHHPSRGVKIILEHTSANPTDKLHVGRARNPIIGDTLTRILRSAGYNVETQYYVDDLGKQTARKILELRYPNWDRDKYKTGYQWATSVTTEDSDVYDPEKARELDMIMDGLERVKPDVLSEAKDVCSEMMDKIIIPSLERIKIKIDRFVNESQFMLDDSVNKVMGSLRESEFCDMEEGAYYIDLAPFDVKSGKDKFFFSRSDGKSLYATRDIAYHHWKFNHCDFAINILGEDHKLETEYVRVGLRLTGEEKAPENIFYAFVNLPEGRMSTRHGKVVYLDDLMDEAYERALVEVKKRREDLSAEEMTAIAEQVGQGAIRFNIIRVQSEKKIVFKWEDALNFEGDSAPFIQYAHARACSILRKAERDGEAKGYSKDDVISRFNADLIKNPYEISLVRTLGSLPGVVLEAAEKRRAHQVAAYAHELAAEFNQFYRECSVLQAGADELVISRLGLVEATRCVLKNAVELLGITATGKM